MVCQAAPKSSTSVAADCIDWKNLYIVDAPGGCTPRDRFGKTGTSGNPVFQNIGKARLVLGSEVALGR